MRLWLRDVALALGVPLEREDDRLVTSVESDSRSVTAGALFVCIRGERADGHDFAASAARAGAVAVLAERALPDAGVPVLVVEDAVQALGRIAALWRGRTSARVVGITGTAGKTTVKEVLAQVLEQRGRTARNALNLNNQIGMPSSMLRASGDEAFWVFEAGISHEGDMDELAPVLRPDVALILNVGPGHTEGLGDRGVAWHKARLLCGLAPQGRALVCADYPDLVREALACQREAAATAPFRLDFFSAQDEQAACHAACVGDGIYAVTAWGARFEVEAPFCGAYGAENVAAVVAAATVLGLTPAEIQAGLKQVQLPRQRFACITAGNWQVIDDTYNANPLSMSRMVAAAREKAGHGPLYVMLGEMRELGACAAEEHRRLGRLLAQVAPEAIFWKGGCLDAVRQGLREGGYAGDAHPVADAGEFAACATAFLHRGGVLLCKGSRSNRLEDMVSAFLNLLEK